MASSKRRTTYNSPEFFKASAPKIYGLLGHSDYDAGFVKSKYSGLIDSIINRVEYDKSRLETLTSQNSKRIKSLKSYTSWKSKWDMLADKHNLFDKLNTLPSEPSHMIELEANANNMLPDHAVDWSQRSFVKKLPSNVILVSVSPPTSWGLLYNKCDLPLNHLLMKDYPTVLNSVFTKDGINIEEAASHTRYEPYPSTKLKYTITKPGDVYIDKQMQFYDDTKDDHGIVEWHPSIKMSSSDKIAEHLYCTPSLDDSYKDKLLYLHQNKCPTYISDIINALVSTDPIKPIIIISLACSVIEDPCNYFTLDSDGMKLRSNTNCLTKDVGVEDITNDPIIKEYIKQWFTTNIVNYTKNNINSYNNWLEDVYSKPRTRRDNRRQTHMRKKTIASNRRPTTRFLLPGADTNRHSKRISKKQLKVLGKKVLQNEKSKPKNFLLTSLLKNAKRETSNRSRATSHSRRSSRSGIKKKQKETRRNRALQTIYEVNN